MLAIPRSTRMNVSLNAPYGDCAGKNSSNPWFPHIWIQIVHRCLVRDHVVVSKESEQKMSAWIILSTAFRLPVAQNRDGARTGQQQDSTNTKVHIFLLCGIFWGPLKLDGCSRFLRTSTWILQLRDLAPHCTATNISDKKSFHSERSFRFCGAFWWLKTFDTPTRKLGWTPKIPQISALLCEPDQRFPAICPITKYLCIVRRFGSASSCRQIG